MTRSEIGQERLSLTLLFGASFIRELLVYDVRCMDIFVTTLEKFENGGFTLKTRSGKSRDYGDVIAFEKLYFQNVFRPHEDEMLAFSNAPCSV